ncbi:translation initiation factor IF-2-like [Motacilla alba alba]|uniref:translation initiation factor IF-2-like n=1 Tax=Motacilla alba alba TaxID=1094192 RepID=UPI0018D56B1E|nr:translation initiation factor IF-2-like [Motacilla alba alba]
MSGAPAAPLPGPRPALLLARRRLLAPALSGPDSATRSPAEPRPSPLASGRRRCTEKAPVAFGELGHRAAGEADGCLAPAPARRPAAAPRAASLPVVHGASHNRALPRLALQARSSDRAPGGGARRPVLPRRRASPPAADVRAVPGPGRFGSVALAERPRPGRSRRRRLIQPALPPSEGWM